MFHYKSCGLDNIFLKNGYDEKQTAYGTAVSIRDIAGLHRAIGLHIVRNKPNVMNKKEIAFLRKELDLPQRQLALTIGVNESTVRNWESGRSHITKPADRMLRALYMESVCQKSGVRELLERLTQLNRETYSAKTLELSEYDGEWEAAAA